MPIPVRKAHIPAYVNSNSPDVPAKVNPFQEIGWTGLNETRGTVQEEWLRQLSGRYGMKIYKEMRDSDPVIGAYLLAVKQQLAAVEWTVESGSDDESDREIATFIASCIDDMDHTWADFIVGALSKLEFGWSFAEMVYKKRNGRNPGRGKPASEYNDGMIGWAKMPFRSQDTLERWVFSDHGDILALVQRANYTKFFTIPMAKGLLFRTTVHKNNPEGRSTLRNAYVPYFYRKRLEEYEATGVERDLAGIPVIGLPPELFSDSASQAEKAALAYWKKVATELRHDERGSIVHPIIYDEAGRELVKVSLLSAPGNRQHDISGIVARYEKQIAMSVMADVILLGHEAVGSLALGSVKREMYMASLQAHLGEIEAVLNRYEIPRILALNGMNPEIPPKLRAGSIEQVDPSGFADIVQKTKDSGWLTPSDEDESWFRSLIGVPQRDEDADEDVG